MFSQLSYLTSIPKMLGHSWMIFLATLFFTFQAPTLEAYGGGKTGEVLEYQGTKWNGVYFTTADDVKGVAVIPNSSGVSMTSSEGRTVISLRGSISKDIGYLIATSLYPDFVTVSSGQNFLEMIQEANPTHHVNLIDAKQFGAKYAADLTPIDPKKDSYWRFLYTENHLIEMGTNDTNEARRHHFFDGLHLQ